MQPTSRLPSRLSPSALLELLGLRLARADGARTALLAISLSPTDRSLATGRGRTERVVLGEVARRIHALLRSEDRFAFASSEEVWVMLADLPTESLAELAARTLLERLRRPIAAPAPHGAARELQLRPAVGVAWARACNEVDSLSMVAAATDAIASRRGSGRDTIHLRQVKANQSNTAMQKDVERELVRALEDNDLEVHFQPQVDLRSGECCCVEALIRWRRADGRNFDPEAIVAICERRNLIVPLTRFTLNTALRQMRGWDCSGIEVSVAVNLSAATLSDASLPMMVSQALDTWEMPARRLTLELTESALIRNQEMARDTMHHLRELGCRLSIDDFGTGYSPYTYLRQYSFDELKIDQSFVRPMNSDRADLRIVQSLIDLAHAFGMHAVAEGVEDEAAQTALRDLGCDLAQGWHLSAALAPDDFAAWYLARRAAVPA